MLLKGELLVTRWGGQGACCHIPEAQAPHLGATKPGYPLHMSLRAANAALTWG